MTAFWKKESGKPTRHTDPDEAVARYLDQLHQADVAGASPPASALNGLGDAYLDKGDVASAVDHYRQAAEVYAREGMHTNAIACLKKVRRHAADEGDAGLLLGRYYAAKKLVPDALAELEAYAERKQRTGDRKESIEAMKEVVRLVPDDPSRRERLADLLREAGQTEAALSAYREARTRYRSEGARAGAERANRWIEELGGGPEPAPGEPPAAPVVPEDLDPAQEPAAPEPADELVVPGPLDEPDVRSEEDREPADRDPLEGLEIERTSYRDDVDGGVDEEERGAAEEPDERLDLVADVPEDAAPDDEGGDLLTIAQQNVGTEEPVERMPIESSAVESPPGEPVEAPGPAPDEDAPDDEDDDEPPRIELPDGAADLAAAAAELERAAADHDAGPAGEAPGEPDDGSADPGSIVPEPRNHEEMMALAEQHVRTGEPEAAGRYLLIAAEGLREEGRWKDAAHAYGRLAEIGEAREEDFEDWVECARQAGRANAVLEALATASRWHLGRGNAAAARRSAEEMFLVDPDSEVAAELLDRIAGPSGG